ncbi:signal peptidase I [Leptospira semungkisensis]|uniref:Signal peptidase I n=1 Tax=Leptospira semungkisensis TaxID=2484985 RepID=A0A4R9FQF2_9LEPT|nr:signal peptidase I [Leptospira semungkisensis]TGK00801.1 signal peptidase I [Leptospira semungkisensis]
MFPLKREFGEKDKKFDKKKFAQILSISLTIGFTFAFILRVWIFFPFVPETEEMSPTFPKGKRIYISRWVRDSSLFLGDVVLAEHPTQKDKVVLVRIVGKSGDQISLKDKVLFRNGVSEREEKLPFQLQYKDARDPLPSTHSNRDNLSTVLVEDRKYFLLCDNRDDCLDSRDFGQLPFEKILGKVL